MQEQEQPPGFERSESQRMSNETDYENEPPLLEGKLICQF